MAVTRQSAAKEHLAAARQAQRAWAAQSIRARLQIVRAFRREAASASEILAQAVPLSVPGTLSRTPADTLVAEVLPLLEACRFLEKEAKYALAPRRESASSRPAWLGRVSVETRRDPVGIVLIIGPGNYPLLLPGVQVLQALAAGNAVIWKPAPGGESCALAMQRMLVACGLDIALITVLDAQPSSAVEVIRAGVDKVVLTGSAITGRAVMHELAETLTPSVMELSGCDAVFVLEGADLDWVVEALVFGLRLNGSATCMAPRRLFVTESVTNEVLERLATALGSLGAVPIPSPVSLLLRDLIDEATLYGAHLVLDGLSAGEGHVSPILLSGVTPEMRIAQTDIFAPVLSVLAVKDLEAAYEVCPYALSAAIFGPRAEAEALAARLRAGTVVINDLIVPTADPRVAFGGRGKSGFGVTRGREGLLEMTAVKTVVHQQSRSRRAYQATSAAHVGLFTGLAQALHAGAWRTRLAGVRRFVDAARNIK